jgi:hypothetical protein
MRDLARRRFQGKVGARAASPVSAIWRASVDVGIWSAGADLGGSAATVEV